MSNFPFKGFHLAKREDTLGSREEKKVSDRPHTHTFLIALQEQTDNNLSAPLPAASEQPVTQTYFKAFIELPGSQHPPGITKHLIRQ